MATKKALEGLQKRVRVYLNWFIKSTIGEDALTEAEIKEVNEIKVLPKRSLDFIGDSFILGKMKSVMKQREWESVDSDAFARFKKSNKLTTIEKMAIAEAKKSAGIYIKALANNIESTVTQSVSQADKKVLTEIMVRDIVQDKVAQALLRRKTYQELALSLSEALNDTYKPKYETIARTEMHAAKQQGMVHAIVAKDSIFAYSDGIDSEVSIIVQPGHCSECARKYNGPDGNPIVFKLRDLIANGSNAGKSRPERLATVPPQHPNCYCQLKYIPPGYSWENGTLVLTSREALTKALEASTKAAKPKPTAVPAPGPGAASGAADTVVENQGTAATISAKGPGEASSNAETLKWVPNDQIPEGAKIDHRTKQGAYIEPGAILPKDLDMEGAETAGKDPTQAKQEARDWSKTPRAHKEQLDHLKSGKFDFVEKLQDMDEKGKARNQTMTYRAVISGNGMACMKPTHDAASTKKSMPGTKSIPNGTSHKREEAAYKAYNMFGLTDHCPPTSTLTVDVGGTKVPTSMQSWQDGYSPTHAKLKDKLKAEGTPLKKASFYTELLKNVPADKVEHVKNKMNEISVMNIIMNSNDAHANNVLVSEDFSDIKPIDHGSSFANGMMGIRNDLHAEMHLSGAKLKVPDHMMERLSKMSLGDVQRSIGDDVEDWAVAQTFLRGKYVEHLQKTEGHLDYKKFISTYEGELPIHDSDYQDMVGKDEPGTTNRRHLKTMPQDLFQSFAKKFIEENGELGQKLKDMGAIFNSENKDMVTGEFERIKSDPNHPRHAEVFTKAYEETKAANPEELSPAKFKGKEAGSYEAPADPRTVARNRRKGKRG